MTFAFSTFQTHQALIELQEYPLATPLFATLTDIVQRPENKTTLSSVFATLTRRVMHKFFVCHSYKKHPGWGHTSCPLSLIASPAIPFAMRTYAKRTRNSFRIRTSKTQDLKPFRIRTYEKKPQGDAPFPFIAALPALCHNHRSCIAARPDNFSACEDFPKP
jgi:hypothetical protein